MKLPSIALLALFSLVGCQAIAVTTDYDKNVDFTEFQTYRWVPPIVRAEADPFVVQCAEEAILRELEAKGFTPADFPDFLVRASGLGERHLGVLPGVDWKDDGERIEGTIRIDILDGSERKPLWLGAIDVVLTSSDQEVRRAEIDAVIARLLAAFPPE